MCKFELKSTQFTCYGPRTQATDVYSMIIIKVDDMVEMSNF